MMTLKEADEAAQKRLPVLYEGTEYIRITQTGYKYDENGKRSPFVQLLDKCLNSVTDADPALCELAKKEDNE